MNRTRAKQSFMLKQRDNESNMLAKLKKVRFF